MITSVIAPAPLTKSQQTKKIWQNAMFIHDKMLQQITNIWKLPQPVKRHQ